MYLDLTIIVGLFRIKIGGVPLSITGDCVSPCYPEGIPSTEPTPSRSGLAPTELPGVKIHSKKTGLHFPEPQQHNVTPEELPTLFLCTHKNDPYIKVHKEKNPICHYYSKKEKKKKKEISLHTTFNFFPITSWVIPNQNIFISISNFLLHPCPLKDLYLALKNRSGQLYQLCGILNSFNLNEQLAEYCSRVFSVHFQQ